MNTNAADLFLAAERLDESPIELLNGGAADALRALDASASEAEAVAGERGIELSTVNALWERAGARLRAVPDPDAVFAVAADAAVLLYAAAWVLDSDSVTTEQLLNLL
jgi:hypothetical protein